MTSKTRVLCVGVDLCAGGAERAQVVLLRHLSRALLDVEVIYLRKTGELLSALPQDMAVRFVFGSRISLFHPLRLLRTILVLVPSIRRADVVFVMIEGGLTYLVVLLSWLLRRRVAAWLQVSWSAMLGDRRFWHRWLSRLVYPLADRVIAVSQGVAEDLLDFAPALAGKIEVVPNPIDLDATRRMAREPVGQEAAAWFDRRVVVAVGRLHRQKGFDLLIRAFAEVLREGLDWKLLIVGEGPERGRLQRLVAELALEERVWLPGFIRNPYALMARSHLFVLSSRYEGLPTVLIEALALGLPVVAADCYSGPREILGGDYQFLVSPGDARALGGAMLEAMRRVEAGMRDLQRCVRVSERYAAPLVTARIERVIVSLVDGRGGREGGAVASRRD